MEDFKYCINCGKKIKATAMFCTFCGASQSETENSERIAPFSEGAFKEPVSTVADNGSQKKPKPIQNDDVDMISATTKTLENFTDFSSKASRSEFWWSYLGLACIQTIIYIIVGIAYNSAGVALQAFLFIMFIVISIFISVAMIALGVRRLHDIGKDGWLILLGLVPFVGWIIMIYFYIQPSEK